MKLTRILLLVSVVFALVPTVKADIVTDWNARTVGHASTPGVRPGPTWVQDVVVVQLAVYDAVQALEGDYQPYCGSIPGASGSITAAVSKAARDVLVNRFPGRLDLINAEFAAATMGIDPNDPGFAVGAAAAACMIARRANDGAFPNPPPPPFTGGLLPGEWQPTGSGPLVFPWLGSVTPYTMRSNDQFRADAPPNLTSPEYTRAYREVKELGRGTGSMRTTEQTDLALFWNGNFPGQFNKLARDLAIAHSLSVSESSRLLALVDTAMADGMIAAWADKVHYNFWRPETAIKKGDLDGNGKTEKDADWMPLVGTPPYPDHTSGANVLSGSALRALSLYFGTNEMEFSIMTTNAAVTDPAKRVRNFTKFSEVRDQVEDARIFQGIHFRFADADARKQGEHIAHLAAMDEIETGQVGLEESGGQGCAPLVGAALIRKAEASVKWRGSRRAEPPPHPNPSPSRGEGLCWGGWQRLLTSDL